MARARRTLRTVGMLGAAALVAAGCGGGETPPAGTAGTPAPGTDPNATGVAQPGDPNAPADPNATGAIDPATGLPVDPATSTVGGGAGATATVPDLSGDDVGGGLGSLESSPIFAAGAIDAESAKELFKPKDEGKEADTSATLPTDPVKSAPAFAGAKIYVDGIVHDVDKNGTFPKGNPVFRLLSVTAGDIEIELIAGEFTSGGGVGTVLDKGELVSLVNSSEQLTYRVKYLRPIASADGISF